MTNFNINISHQILMPSVSAVSIVANTELAVKMIYLIHEKM